ncbi:Uma2 family endonuclease [Catenuloplanes indicus]|uniref:Uma2 family endonuclease n=1 Tax=Catenuloplanes indicus TaxID=137267 RepID=A0AAE3W3G6_9ACTN|nr:Uma2 family endonuclease [Catenuloplanes indicus]MDQ0369098.1 Uma2 family endonuclease [Catenuloplanes indicus]
MGAIPIEEFEPIAETPAGPSFQWLGIRDEPWTPQLAFELLPETNGPRVEVFRGSVVVSPHAGVDHQSIEFNLASLLKPPARRAGCFLYHEINVVSGDDLFIPDLVILRESGAGRTSVAIETVMLLGEIVSAGNRRKDVIDRPKEYAAAGVPFFLRVDFRNRVPAITLFALEDGEYQPLVAAAAGTMFVMKEPFAVEFDPAELLDE